VQSSRGGSDHAHVVGAALSVPFLKSIVGVTWELSRID
jgi:hypothetical protein